jgi:hypothetical protein
LVQGLRQAAAALQLSASDNSPAAELLQQQLEALAACVALLCDALAAAGATGLPAALQLLRTQTQPWQASTGLAQPPRLPPALHLAGLCLQTEAAAAAVERQLAEGPSTADGEQADGPTAAQQQKHQQQQLFQQWFLGAFADCYASEVEALQESEPPIPAGVLLHCVRLAADSEALFPQHHKQLVLQAAAAASGATPAGLLC